MNQQSKGFLNGNLGCVYTIENGMAIFFIVIMIILRQSALFPLHDSDNMFFCYFI